MAVLFVLFLGFRSAMGGFRFTNPNVGPSCEGLDLLGRDEDLQRRAESPRANFSANLVTLAVSV